MGELREGGERGGARYREEMRKRGWESKSTSSVKYATTPWKTKREKKRERKTKREKEREIKF